MQSRDLVETHRLIFSAKLYDHQGPIARGGGRTNPPPLHWRRWRNTENGRGLTRARPGGGVHICAPISFSQIAGNGGAQCHQIWHSYSFILCASCVKILTQGHIRSGLQVTLSDVTSKRKLTTLTPCHSHSSEPSVFKLLEVDEVNSSSNLFILDFSYS